VPAGSGGLMSASGILVWAFSQLDSMSPWCDLRPPLKEDVRDRLALVGELGDSASFRTTIDGVSETSISGTRQDIHQLIRPAACPHFEAPESRVSNRVDQLHRGASRTP
jgi:hypothetical protein